ncbi:MAG TPA: PAS domain S-box protein, partial [Polyangiaceae bacterium]
MSAVTVRSLAGHVPSNDECDAERASTVAANGSAEHPGILDAVDVPIIVVGLDCKLIRFNCAAAETLELTPSDLRQRPCDIGALAGTEGLEKLCLQVIDDASPRRREIQYGDRRFVLRAAPYVGTSGQIEGAVLAFTNVTAFRASIEQAIYEREYTKTILNTVIDPLVVLDSKLHVQTANRAFYSMFGASRDKTQGVPLRDLGEADWKASALWESLAEMLAGDGDFRPFEIEREFPASGPRSVLIDARRVPRDGEATILLTLHDITDRKNAEKDLRRGQEELLDFVENASVGMHWVGPDGIIQWANRTELELLGYTRDEYIGRHFAQFHADESLGVDLLRRLTNGEEVHDCGAQLRCKDGSIRDVLINSNVLWEGDKFIHTRCFTRDVTQGKRAEEALRESERRFREMIDALPVAVYTTDADGRLSHFNPACIELAGRVPEVGKDSWCVTWKLYRADGTAMQPDECPMAVALKKGEIVRGEEAIAERPDGTRVWFLPYPTPLRDAEGRVVGGINMLVDVTERKRAEQALMDADKRKDEFLATLAHELRNPLAPIRNSLHILRAVNSSTPSATRVHDMMERQVAHMVRLVDDLLELSRISRGQIELKKATVGLATIIEHAVEASMPFIEKHGHQL